MRTLFLALILALPAAAQGITHIDGIELAGDTFADPADIRPASVGTQLVLDGSGFGGLTGTAKPKVWISSPEAPKKRALKVLAATDAQLTVEVKTGIPGDFDLTVQPKGKGLAALVATDVVRLLAPQFEEPNPPAAAPGALVTLSGLGGLDAFGSKPGKVRVGGRKAVVESWSPGEIIFAMPAKLANGLYTVEVANKVAEATVDPELPTAPFALQMVDSTFDLGGPDRFSARLNGKKTVIEPSFLSGVGFVTFSAGPPAVTTLALNTVFGKPTFTLRIPGDLGEMSFPLVVSGDPDGGLEVDVCTAASIFECLAPQPGDAASWTTQHGEDGAHDYVFVLHGFDFNPETGGPQLVASFAGTLLRTEGGKAPLVYQLTQGDIRITDL